MPKEIQPVVSPDAEERGAGELFVDRKIPMRTHDIPYPRIYSASLGWKLFLAIIGFPLGIGGLAGTWYFGTGHEITNVVQMYLLVGISIAMMICGFWCAISPLFSKALVLQEDLLRVPGLFTETVIRRSDISGYRILMVQGIRALQLEFTTPSGLRKKTKVTMLFKPDEAFISWFDGIPDRDAMEFAASVQEVQMDARLGSSPEERLENASKARKIGRAMNVGVFVVAGWAIFYPRPYTLVFLVSASLPLGVLWLCRRYEGSFSIDDTGKNTARADLTAVLIMPGFILGLRALSDVQMVEVTQLIAPALIGLTVLVLCITWVAPLYRKSFWKLGVLALLMSAYPASTIAIANATFDQGPCEQYVLSVLGKRHTTGKGASQYFKVPPWGSITGVNEIRVSRDLYKQTETGQTICLSLHSGAFALEWYSARSVTDCRR